jgi:hypothetical protein
MEAYMRRNRLALMGTTLAAVLLGACSQAADMPTAVAMPDVLANAATNRNNPVVTISSAFQILLCPGVPTDAFVFQNLVKRVEKRGLNRHIGQLAGNPEAFNVEVLGANAETGAFALWASEREEYDGNETLTFAGIAPPQKLVSKVVFERAWDGEVTLFEYSPGVFAKVPLWKVTYDWKVTGSKTNYFWKESYYERWDPESGGTIDVERKIETNCAAADSEL